MVKMVGRWSVPLTGLALLLLAFLLAGGAAAAPNAQSELCSGEFLPVAPPLPELGAEEYVRMEGGPTGFSGGLYPGGANTRPEAHEAAGLAAAERLQPLDAEGQPATDGKIVLISVGMSNTSSEFNTFMDLVHQWGGKNDSLVLVNGAQGGRVSEHWADPESDVWPNLDAQLHHARVSHEQVQVAWIKLTQTRGGDFPAKAEALQADLVAVVQNLKAYLPNLQIAYLSSRTRSYLYWRGLSPEPVAYETGFAVKWLVEAQIEGQSELNYDPAQGAVVAPYLSWGPYLWIDGLNPRSDGLVWTAEDLIRDCTHPSPGGNQKVAEMLLGFFTTDTTTTSWFLPAGVATATAVAPPATATSAPATATATTVAPTATATGQVAEVVLPLVASALEETPALPSEEPEIQPAETIQTAGPDQTRARAPEISVQLSLAVIIVVAGAAFWWRSRR